MLTTLPYIVVAIALLWLYKCEQRRVKVLSPRTAGRVAFIVVFLFIGLRGHLYSDFINYYPFYEELPTITLLDSSAMNRYLFEPGFVIYSSLVKSLGIDYFGWVALGTFLDLWVFRTTFQRYTNSVVLPFLFFMAYNGLTIEFNLMRNAKAMDLFLLSIPYLRARKVWPYMLLNLLGTTFHLSSVVYLPLYFLLHMSMGPVLRWGGIVFANVIFLGGVSVIADIIESLGIFRAMAFYDKLSGHAAHSTAGYALSFGHLERTFAIVLFTALYRRLGRQRADNLIFYNCLWIYYTTFLLFHEVEVLANRIPLLFVSGYWILYTNIATLRYRWRQVVLLIAILLALAKIVTANTSPPARYENILTGTTDYHTRRREVMPYLEKQ